MASAVVMDKKTDTQAYKSRRHIKQITSDSRTMPHGWDVRHLTAGAGLAAHCTGSCMCSCSQPNIQTAQAQIADCGRSMSHQQLENCPHAAAHTYRGFCYRTHHDDSVLLNYNPRRAEFGRLVFVHQVMEILVQVGDMDVHLCLCNAPPSKV